MTDRSNERPKSAEVRPVRSGFATPVQPETGDKVEDSRQRTERSLEGCRERLKRFVRLRLDGRIAARVDASDIVQETFLDASRRLTELLGLSDKDLYGWLKQLALERTIDACRRHLQAQRRSVLRELSTELPLGNTSGYTLGDVLATSATSAGGRVTRREELARVGAALEKLSPADRQLLVLRHIVQLDVAALAETLHTSRTAITTRHLRAVRRLRRILCDNSRGSSP